MLRIGDVDAVHPGLDAQPQLVGQRGLDAADALQSRPDTLRHRAARALGCGGRPAIAPIESRGGGEVCEDRVALGARALRAAQIAETLGLVELVGNVVEPIAAPRFSLRIEHSAAVAARRA